MFNTHLNYLECVLDESTLNSLVNSRVSPERRSVVNLEHPRLQLLVEHDIEAKQFETAVRLLGLATAVNMLKLWLDSHYSLHNDGLNFVPDLTCAPGHPRLTLLSRRLRHDTLETVIKAKFVCVIIKLIIFLVERIVGQVSV